MQQMISSLKETGMSSDRLHSLPALIQQQSTFHYRATLSLDYTSVCTIITILQPFALLLPLLLLLPFLRKTNLLKKTVLL